MKRKKFDSEKAFSKEKFFNSFKVMGEGIKNNRKEFFGYFIFTIMDSILYALITVVISKLTKCLTSNNTEANELFGIVMNWKRWIGVACALLVLIVFCDYITNIYCGLFAKKIEIYLRLKALNKLVNLDIHYYSKNQLGLIMSRVITDTQGAGDAFIDFLSNILFSVVSIVSMFTFMFILDYLLATIIFAIFMILMIIIWIIFIFYRRASIISIDTKQAIDADITDRLINIRLIKSNASENIESKRNEKLNKKYDNKLQKVVGLQSLLAFFTFSFAWLLPIVTVLATIAIYNTTMEPKQFSSLLISFVSASNNILYALFVMPIWMRGLTRLSNCVMRLNQIYNNQSLLTFVENGTRINQITNIKFDKVKFSYPDYQNKPVLAELTFNFEKNKSYAFVGPTGIGKSTIAKLLLRFYDTSSGEILINDINIKNLDIVDYLDKVGYVEQEPQIFYGTIMDNIKYSSFNKSDEEAIEAAKLAKIHNYIKKLPDGYDTILGERGFIFSGGQKQRIIIARLFLKNPQLLILDEATSALDNIVEKKIQEEFDKLMKGRITIVIAHRLSTIKNVDEIIVLNKKGIAQKGNFNNLINENGPFKNLYSISSMK